MRESKKRNKRSGVHSQARAFKNLRKCGQRTNTLAYFAGKSEAKEKKVFIYFVTRFSFPPGPRFLSLPSRESKKNSQN
jgi:hypothetical protein